MLTERILAGDDVSPECLVGMARRLKFSVHTGGEEYVSANINALKDEIKYKLADVCTYSKDPNISGWVEDIGASLENMDVKEFMRVSQQVCDLFDEYFDANKINAGKLEKKLYGTVNCMPPQEANASGNSFSMSKIKTELEKFLSGADVYYILEILRRGQPRLLTAFGLKLPEEESLNFFAVMSDFFPHDSYFAVFMGKHAVREGDKGKLMVAIERVRAFRHDVMFIPTLSAFARKIQNREILADVLKLLEPHLYDPACLNEYSLAAKELEDREAMTRAAEALENSQFTLLGLRVYARLAITLRDNDRLKCAALMMEDELDDLVYLKLYTKIALILRDKTLMETAYARLQDITVLPWFIERYGLIAFYLNDYEGMIRAHGILEKFMDNPRIRNTYDKLEFRINDINGSIKHERVQQ